MPNVVHEISDNNNSFLVLIIYGKTSIVGLMLCVSVFGTVFETFISISVSEKNFKPNEK